MSAVKVISNTVVQPSNPDDVREQIKNMTGHSSDEEFGESLPDTTLAPPEEEGKPGRKKRVDAGQPRKKRNAVAETEIEIDPIVERFNRRSTGLGGAQIVRTAFKTSQQPLDHEEDEELSDFFYVLSKKKSMNIADSWMLLGLYCTFMLVRFFIVRTEYGKHLEKMFDIKPTSKEGK